MTPVRRKRYSINLLIPFLIVALVFGALLWNKHRATRTTTPTPVDGRNTGKRTVVLFFVADGNRLARESRDIDSCPDLTACVKDTLDELSFGPVGELDDSLPEGSTINGVRIEGATAIIDLNRNFVAEMPSGSSAEMMAVYSIVNTVNLNFPKLTSVLLTVEGQNKTVLGHLDLSEPLQADYSLEALSQSSGDAAQKSTTVTKGKP